MDYEGNQEYNDMLILEQKGIINGTIENGIRNDE